MPPGLKFWPAVPGHVWDRIRAEFTLPTEAELARHFETLGESEAMQRAVRVFVGEGNVCPGFQLERGLFREPVLRLFQHAMALKIPHNVFAAWMISPLPNLPETRPIDVLSNIQLLRKSLAAFAESHGPANKRR